MHPLLCNIIVFIGGRGVSEWDRWFSGLRNVATVLDAVNDVAGQDHYLSQGHPKLIVIIDMYFLFSYSWTVFVILQRAGQLFVRDLVWHQSGLTSYLKHCVVLFFVVQWTKRGLLLN